MPDQPLRPFSLWFDDFLNREGSGSAARIARGVGCDRSTIHRWRNGGGVSVEYVEPLALALGLSLDELKSMLALERSWNDSLERVHQASQDLVRSWGHGISALMSRGAAEVAAEIIPAILDHYSANGVKLSLAQADAFRLSQFFERDSLDGGFRQRVEEVHRAVWEPGGDFALAAESGTTEPGDAGARKPHPPAEQDDA